MSRCGRCMAQIEDGFFCEACRSVFDGLRYERAVERARPGRSPRLRSGPRPRPAEEAKRGRSFSELILIDGGILVEIRTNDVALIRDCCAGSLAASPARDPRVAFQYCIARSGSRDPRYTILRGGRQLGIATSRAEAIASLAADIHRQLAGHADSMAAGLR